MYYSLMKIINKIIPTNLVTSPSCDRPCGLDKKEINVTDGQILIPACSPCPDECAYQF